MIIWKIRMVLVVMMVTMMIGAMINRGWNRIE